jgi:uncharacterized membrane protein
MRQKAVASDLPDDPHPPRTRPPLPETGAQSSNVPTVLNDALRGAGVDPDDPQVSRALEITFMSISGSTSLPPAILLQQWEPLYPGITKKFVEWTEAQTAHRQAIEKARASRSEDRQDRSQAITERAMYLGLILAAAVGIWGSWVVGSVLAVVSVGGPAAATLLARYLHGQIGQPPKR